MIPYANFLYFAVVLYATLATSLLALLGTLRRFWIVLVTLVMLALQYTGVVNVRPEIAVPEIVLLAVYACWQFAVTGIFLQTGQQARRSRPFYLAVAATLLPLALSKLWPVLAPGSLLGFLGISYVTFRAIDVVIGIHDGLIGEVPPVQFLAYLLFFPVISSGPIDRYRRFSADWQRQRTRAELLQDLEGAVQRIARGFLYSFIIAVLIRRYWLDPATQATGLVGNASYMYAYTAYLFFDFAGYSAFAIGISYIFGIRTPENFNQPFIAENIREFWNRWHITLSQWFRDHVYMRFVLTATRRHWLQNKVLISYCGLVTSFGLMGLWHGLAPHFIIYGLYHALLLVGFDAFERYNKRKNIWGAGRMWRLLGIGLTINAVSFGMLLFSGHLLW